MVIIILIVLNIPLFLFIGWLAFDSKAGAAKTFGETIVSLLQILLIPRIVREVLGMDDEGALGLVPIIGFFIACGAMVAGEYWLVAKYFPGWVGP
jgi:hypothetical protein